jgi:hypothetical protein
LALLEKPSLVVRALQLEHAELLTCTETPLAAVDPHTLLLLLAFDEEAFLTRTIMPLAFVEPRVLLLLLPVEELWLQAYEPTWNENDPPYTLPPNEFAFHCRKAAHDSNRAASINTLPLRTTVSPTAATASPFRENTDEYAPYAATPRHRMRSLLAHSP